MDVELLTKLADICDQSYAVIAFLWQSEPVLPDSALTVFTADSSEIRLLIFKP